ncbi:hypothetical protein CEY15_08430 [Dietzia natronolimnaea]|uniref:Uncharacterized protein n=1 Tax=Dietzia natronolimnaea TaxID=161920 RepID=A0A2A2WQ68_9ACTN|nr:hypothetical protein [Dietzia natronolimnaea]PAY23337.1 hypothetical protein CEY15_08430 [Dietzia natronolimnaea]
MPTQRRLFISLVAAPAVLCALAACGNDSATPTADGGDASPVVATPTTTTSTSTSTSAASTSSTTPTSETTTSRASGEIDSIQLRLDSSDEVSPGVLQGYYPVFADIEWMAISAGAAYDGERCAAVITLTGPGGHILQTDRQSTCSGTTQIEPQKIRDDTGTYVVTARVAPWEDAQNPTEGTLEFDVIASGT